MSTKRRWVKISKWAAVLFLISIPILIYVGHSLGARVHYADDPLAQNWDREGPYVFIEDDGALSVEYIRQASDGTRRVERVAGDATAVSVHFPIDGTRFDVELRTEFEAPLGVYEDGNKIFAISDLESNYGALRDFLADAGVIDQGLNWTFGQGHLVLVGDLVDRGYFTTQLLWFIYDLEQAAREQGGRVHYIIGNHELKMMYGDYAATDPKYAEVASLLGREQLDLYGPQSLLGRWMAEKNAVELINGNLFVHGGMHPDLVDHPANIDEINRILRETYYERAKSKHPGREHEILISRDTGPCWYRGYFREDPTQQQIDAVLGRFDADAVVVGHTIQGRVSRSFDGKVIGIDVQHPNDDHKLWPEGRSEALLIDGGTYYRVVEGGHKEKME